MAQSTATEGTARIQGELWSPGARDWADLLEPGNRPIYEEGVRLTGIVAGAKALDVGCGAGGFCRLAADVGAEVNGLDASPAMIEIASERVPEGEFTTGDLQFLPYEDDVFDVVTGFNSFQFAADPVAALAEAGRVAKAGSNVFALVWGREEHTELVALLRALKPLLPPAPPGAPGPFALSNEGALDALFEQAGLGTKDAGYLELSVEYPDEGTMARALMSAGPSVLAGRTSGPDAVRDAIVAALAPFRTAAGGYRLETEWRYVIGVA